MIEESSLAAPNSEVKLPLEMRKTSESVCEEHHVRSSWLGDVHWAIDHSSRTFNEFTVYVSVSSSSNLQPTTAHECFPSFFPLNISQHVLWDALGAPVFIRVLKPSMATADDQLTRLLNQPTLLHKFQNTSHHLKCPHHPSSSK